MNTQITSVLLASMMIVGSLLAATSAVALNLPVQSAAPQVQQHCVVRTDAHTPDKSGMACAALEYQSEVEYCSSLQGNNTTVPEVFYWCRLSTSSKLVPAHIGSPLNQFVTNFTVEGSELQRATSISWLVPPSVVLGPLRHYVTVQGSGKYNVTANLCVLHVGVSSCTTWPLATVAPDYS